MAHNHATKSYRAVTLQWLGMYLSHCLTAASSLITHASTLSRTDKVVHLKKFTPSAFTCRQGPKSAQEQVSISGWGETCEGVVHASIQSVVR